MTTDKHPSQVHAYGGVTWYGTTYGTALRQWHHRVEEHDEGRASKGVLRGGYKHTGA